VDQFFELPDGETDFGFMTFVVRVRQDKRSVLGATTHVDGTARIQTVAAATNPRFHRLIAEFGDLTGVPVLLNTSFNNDAEPIVDSARDAVATFLTTGLDALVIGDYLVDGKIELTADPARCLSLCVSVRPSRRLVRTSCQVGGTARFAIDTAAPVKDPPIVCSEAMFNILGRSSSETTLHSLAEELRLSDSERVEVANAALDLWRRRAIDLHP
jgi:carbamoyltransferase